MKETVTIHIHKDDVWNSTKVEDVEKEMMDAGWIPLDAPEDLQGCIDYLFGMESSLSGAEE